MALLFREVSGILSTKWVPRLEVVRFRRVNVQRPREPHYEKAKFLNLMKPIYKTDESDYLPPTVKCKKNEELIYWKARPDNPYERIIAKELFQRCESSKMVCFVHTNPISGTDKFQARILLKREKMDVQVHSKYTAEKAFKDTNYEAVLSLFNAHNAIIFAEEPNIQKLFSILKKIPQFILMAGIIDGKLLSVSELKKYSEIKDIATARAQLVGVLNACAQQTVSQLMAHPQRLLLQLHHLANPDKDKSENS